MRKIKESKEPSSTLPGTTHVDQSTQTPIEIALQIDENGMTTASNLYAFLELHPAHFSRWCNKNIKNNKFAIPNTDYIVITIDGENSKIGGRPKTDYKITSDFAKKLSMTGNTEKHEQARQYFIACEQGLKVASQRLQESNSKLEEMFINTMKNMNTTLSAINDRLTKLEEQSAKKRLPEKKYSRWKTNTFTKLNNLLSYVNEHSDENLKLSEIIHLVIGETEDTYNIELNDYMEAYKSEFDLEVTPYVIDVINHYKDIRNMFSLTLDLIMEKLHIADKSESHKRNIFDELAAISNEQNEE